MPSNLLDCVQEAFGAVLGEVRTQMALSLAALLPWLCLHFRHSRHAPLAAVCIAVSCTPLIEMHNLIWEQCQLQLMWCLTHRA